MNVNELSFKPKRNWHNQKIWNRGKHTRRVIKFWWKRPDEEYVIDEKGTPHVIYPTREIDGDKDTWVYRSIPIRSAANIENRWLRKYRHHNDDGGRGWWTLSNFVTGKSSRQGMKEKARWWREVNEE